MRSPVLFACAVALAASPAHARHFWQTYGATVPTADGCVWNLNSDYFVPRHCDSGRYDLFSPCKTSHSISPACKSIHPVYAGACKPYCTPFGECHYKWRDHVYKKHCGCTPLACYHGPWKLNRCKKHCPLLKGCDGCDGGCGFDSGGCFDGGCIAGSCHAAPLATAPNHSCCEETYADAGHIGYLPNLEPIGGETLGTIEAIPSAMAGARAGMAGALGGGALGQMAPTTGGGSAPAAGLPSLQLPGLFGS
jgi:hypothetical protein